MNGLFHLLMAYSLFITISVVRDAKVKRHTSRPTVLAVQPFSTIRHRRAYTQRSQFG